MGKIIENFKLVSFSIGVIFFVVVILAIFLVGFKELFGDETNIWINLGFILSLGIVIWICGQHLSQKEGKQKRK